MSDLGVLKVFCALQPFRTGVHKITAKKIGDAYMFSYRGHHKFVDTYWVLQTAQESLQVKNTIPIKGHGGPYYWWAYKIKQQADVVGAAKRAEELYRAGYFQSDSLIVIKMS